MEPLQLLLHGGLKTTSVPYFFLQFTRDDQYPSRALCWYIGHDMPPEVRNAVCKYAAENASMILKKVVRRLLLEKAQRDERRERRRQQHNTKAMSSSSSSSGCVAVAAAARSGSTLERSRPITSVLKATPIAALMRSIGMRGSLESMRVVDKSHIYRGMPLYAPKRLPSCYYEQNAVTHETDGESSDTDID